MATVVSTFKIPEELAKQLSELITTQSIREKLLLMLIDQPTKYNEMEKMLVETVQKIDNIKNIITNRFVPSDYQSDKYIWNYNGWDISGDEVEILNA